MKKAPRKRARLDICNNGNSAAKALSIVLQYWMIPDLGWKPTFSVEKADTILNHFANDPLGITDQRIGDQKDLDLIELETCFINCIHNQFDTTPIVHLINSELYHLRCRYRSPFTFENESLEILEEDNSETALVSTCYYCVYDITSI